MSAPSTIRFNGGSNSCIAYGYSYIPAITDEDSSFVELSHNHQSIIPGLASFGLFDGHGGKYASEQCSTDLHEKIIMSFSRITEGIRGRDSTLIPADIDAYMCEAIRSSTKEMDFLMRTETRSGTTMVSAFILPRPDGTMRVLSPWIGDSRAVIYILNSDGQFDVIPLTEDHKPNLAREVYRIENNLNVSAHRLPVEVDANRTLVHQVTNVFLFNVVAYLFTILPCISLNHFSLSLPLTLVVTQ